MKLTRTLIQDFANHLRHEEKSTATIEKYLRDVQVFCVYTSGQAISKELMVAWKKHLVETGYAVRSINSMLASVNSLLDFIGLSNCKVKNIRTQQQTYCAEDRELTKLEYLRLLAASKKNEQLNLVIQTICGTGIRVSELRYFTVEAVKYGEVTVNCKSKTRTILVPGKLKTIAEQQGFVNVISSEYMLREYMSANTEVFTADAKAIPYITADYARTKRNAILSLCLLLCIDTVKEEVLNRQMVMLSIFNLVLVSGAAVTISPFAIPEGSKLFGYNTSQLFEIPVMVAVMALMTLPALFKKKLSRCRV